MLRAAPVADYDDILDAPLVQLMVCATAAATFQEKLKRGKSKWKVFALDL